MQGKTLKVCVATWHHTPSVFKILCEFSIYYIVNSQVSHPNATYVQSSHKKFKLLLGNILQILKDKATMTGCVSTGWYGTVMPVATATMEWQCHTCCLHEVAMRERKMAFRIILVYFHHWMKRNSSFQRTPVDTDLF